MWNPHVSICRGPALKEHLETCRFPEELNGIAVPVVYSVDIQIGPEYIWLPVKLGPLELLLARLGWARPPEHMKPPLPFSSTSEPSSELLAHITIANLKH